MKHTLLLFLSLSIFDKQHMLNIMKLSLLVLFISTTLPAQVTVDLGSIVIPTGDHTTLDNWRRTHFVPQSQTTLGGAIDNSVTTVVVAANQNIAVGDQIVIESEAMTVSAVSTVTLTVSRGSSGTTAASHAAAVIVQKCLYASMYKMITAGLTATYARLINQIAIDAATAPPPGEAFAQAVTYTTP